SDHAGLSGPDLAVRGDEFNVEGAHWGSFDLGASAGPSYLCRRAGRYRLSADDEGEVVLPHAQADDPHDGVAQPDDDEGEQPLGVDHVEDPLGGPTPHERVDDVADETGRDGHADGAEEVVLEGGAEVAVRGVDPRPGHTTARARQP